MHKPGYKETNIMKKKKSKKKIIIGAAAVLVVAGGVTVAGQRNSTEDLLFSCKCKAENGFFCPGRCGEKGNKTDRV